MNEPFLYEKWQQNQKTMQSIKQQLEDGMKLITELLQQDNISSSHGLTNTYSYDLAQNLLKKQQSLISELEKCDKEMHEMAKKIWPEHF